MKIVKQSFCALIFLCVCVYSLTAELLQSETFGYAFDLPEGYTLIDKTGNTRYLFQHDIAPVELIVAVYPLSQYKTAEAALLGVFSQLSVQKPSGDYEIAQTQWSGLQSAIASVQFSASGSRSSVGGWSVSLELPESKGMLVLVCYADLQYALECESLIISTLDSVFFDYGSFHVPGPMTSFVFPLAGDIQTTVDIQGALVSVLFDADDAEANQFVVDREFDVLLLYADSPLLESAWQRYYRTIYRDGFQRMKRASFSIYNALFYAPSNGKRIQTPFELAQTLLHWTQTFTYERNLEGSDFLSLPDTLLRQGGDCDSRSLLLALLLNQMAVDSVLFVSPSYSHALLGVYVEGSGARMDAVETASGEIKQYLVGETTADVALGLISQDMAHPDQWFSVSFY